MAAYIVVSKVKKLAKEYGKRVGKDYLASLDQQISEWVRRSCVLHNGSKKTLDASVAMFSRRAA